LSLAGRFSRPRPSREATMQNASAGTEVTSGGYRNLRSFLSYFKYITFFSTTIRCYTLTQQYNYNIFLHRTRYTNRLGSRCPSMPRTLPGGFRSRSLQVFTASLGATRSHDRLTLPTDQSSLSTSSQISSIKRRNVVSIMSRAICRSSLSVGIRPVLKTGS
jgi:hypothetical protein